MKMAFLMFLLSILPTTILWGELVSKRDCLAQETRRQDRVQKYCKFIPMQPIHEPDLLTVKAN